MTIGLDTQATGALPPGMALMIREGSGIVCLCMLPDRADALRLKPMVEVNRSHHATAFNQSIEAAFGVSPGHVFPLIARPGGVLERQGHTEAAVDLAPGRRGRYA